MKAARLLFYQFIMLNTKRRKFLTALSCVVVFCTVYALIIPAITMSKSNPTLAAERTQGAPGETLTVQVSAEADNTQEERVFLRSATGDNAGLDDGYVFDEYGVTHLLDDNGKTFELRREAMSDGSTEYWFVLPGGERTSFSLPMTNDVATIEPTEATVENNSEEEQADKSVNGSLWLYAACAGTLEDARAQVDAMRAAEPAALELVWEEQVEQVEADTQTEEPAETEPEEIDQETGEAGKESGRISGSVSEETEVKTPRTGEEPSETTDTDTTGTKISGKVSQRAPRKAPTYTDGTALTVRDDIKNSGHLATNVNSLGDGESVVWYKQTVTGNETPSTNGWEEVSRIKVTGDNYNMGEGTTADNAWVNPTLDGGAKTEITTTYYRAVVVNSSGQTLATSNAFAVPYYATIQNGSFEYPAITSGFNWFIESGTNGIVWKTTATNGSGNHNIEIARTSQAAYNAYHTNGAADGNQFAELNSDAAGALYQDVLAVPGSTMYWQLSHRARDRSANTTRTDTMYVVTMSTALAEQYNITTQAAVQDVINYVRGNLSNHEYPGANVVEINDDNRAWYEHSGEYVIPDGQYMTRYFFVAGATASGDDTIGNLLDSVSFSTELPPPSPDQARFEVVKTFDSTDMTEEEIEKLKNNLTFTLNYKVTETTKISRSSFQKGPYSLYRTTTTTLEDKTITIDADNNNMVWTRNANGIYTGTYIGTAISIPSDSSNTTYLWPYYYRTETTSSTEYSVTEDLTKADLDGYDRISSTAENTDTDATSIIQTNRIGFSNDTIPKGELTMVTFHNRYQKQTGSLSFTKMDEKTNPLPGAEFALYTDASCTTPLEPNSTAVTATSDENGKVLFENIPVGTYYVKETNPPENYQKKRRFMK